MLDILARQVAAPVQFVKGLETLYAAGARVFVEVGPEEGPAGLRRGRARRSRRRRVAVHQPPEAGRRRGVQPGPVRPVRGGARRGRAARLRRLRRRRAAGPPPPAVAADRRSRARATPLRPPTPIASARSASSSPTSSTAPRDLRPAARGATQEPVVISGAALGLPGTERVFDDANVGRLLHGEQLIDVIPSRLRHAMLDKHITRLVKSDDGAQLRDDRAARTT